MGKKYSATTGGFYTDTSTVIPEDAVDLTDAEYDQVFIDSANGLSIFPGEKGKPASGEYDASNYMEGEELTIFQREKFISNINDNNVNDEPVQAVIDSMNVQDLHDLRLAEVTFRYKHVMDWI